MVFSGFGSLVPGTVRCHLPGSLACPGGWLGPAASSNGAGSQWFNITGYDYGFWIINTVDGTNESSSWDLFEGFTIHVNATSLPPDPSFDGTGQHGVGLLVGGALLLNIAAPVGSWASASFVAPSTPSTGNEIYCTIYCGPGHENLRANIVNVVPPSVQAQATGGPLTGYVPLFVDLNGSALGGRAPYSYSWNFGDGGTVSTSQDPSHTYTVAGSYTAVVTVTDSTGASSTAALQIAALPPAALSATASASPTSGVAPLSVDFTGAGIGGSPPYAYAWSFGDGSNGSGSTASHRYSAMGNYSATLSVTDATGTKATKSVAITVLASLPPLAVHVTASPSSGTAPFSATFAAKAISGTSPFTAIWNFGDGSDGSGMLSSHNYTVAGSYQVTVTVTDDSGRTGTASTYVNVSGGTSAPLSVRASTNVTGGTAPLPVTAFASIEGGTGVYTSVTWTLGDGSVANGLEITHSYAHPGNYVLVVQVSDSGGNLTSASTSISVLGLNLSVALNGTLGDAPFSVNATASVFGGNGHYSPIQWSWGDGTSSTGNPAVHTYNVTSVGVFYIRASTSDSNGLTVARSVPIRIDPKDVVTLSINASTGGAPEVVSFAAVGAANSDLNDSRAQWDFGNGVNATGPLSTHEEYLHPGIYHVSVRVRDLLGLWVSAGGIVRVPAPPPPGGNRAGVVIHSLPWIGNGVGNPTSNALGLLFLMSLGLLYLLWSGPKNRWRPPSPGPPRRLYLPEPKEPPHTAGDPPESAHS